MCGRDRHSSSIAREFKFLRRGRRGDLQKSPGLAVATSMNKMYLFASWIDSEEFLTSAAEVYELNSRRGSVILHRRQNSTSSRHCLGDVNSCPGALWKRKPNLGPTRSY
jgi:hypothetical protein